jgi:hypothetical protein
MDGVPQDLDRLCGQKGVLLPPQLYCSLFCWHYACELAKKTSDVIDGLHGFLAEQLCLECHEIAGCLVFDGMEFDPHPLAHVVACLEASGWGDMIEHMAEFLD